MVPLGPRFDFNTSFNPSAALILMARVCPLLATSASGFKAKAAAADAIFISINQSINRDYMERKEAPIYCRLLKPVEGAHISDRSPVAPWRGLIGFLRGFPGVCDFFWRSILYSSSSSPRDIHKMQADSFIKLKVKYSRSNAAPSHTILLRRHQISASTQSKEEMANLAADRSVFLIQLPLCSSIEQCRKNIRKIFKSFGKVNKVIFHKMKFSNHGSGGGGTNNIIHGDFSELDCQNRFELDKFMERNSDRLLPPATACILVFEDTESCDKAISYLKSGKKKFLWPVISSQDHSMMNEHALSRWKRRHMESRPSYDVLNDKIDAELGLYIKEQNRKQQEMEQLRNVPDKDGWIKVLNSGFSVSKPKKLKKFPGFYRFQKAQEKYDKLRSLQQLNSTLSSTR